MMLTILGNWQKERKDSLVTLVSDVSKHSAQQIWYSLQACWKPYFPKASLYVTESSKPKPRFFLKMEVYVLTGFEIPCSPSDLSYTFIDIVANVDRAITHDSPVSKLTCSCFLSCDPFVQGRVQQLKSVDEMVIAFFSFCCKNVEELGGLLLSSLFCLD